MKVAFCYPPISKNRRFPTLPQNRQFIYTASGKVRIFPVVMASAATWVKNLNHKVLWLDGITRKMSWKDYEREMTDFKPDLVVLEGKAPVMPKLWKYTLELKKKSKTKIVLVGDHVSFFPEESLRESQVDYIITGGDYDFLLISLVNHLEKGEKLEGGIWFREIDKKKNFQFKNSGKGNLNHNLELIPVIDRELTRWKDYGEAYLFSPAGYIMSGRGCGIDSKSVGVCNFCIWQYGLWGCKARLISPQKVILEIKNLIRLGVKEIFDDNESGACWDREWLEKFYQLLNKEKLLGKVIFSSNVRGDQLTPSLCRLLKKLGYRLLKVGLESGSNETLRKLNKKETIEQIIRGVKNAKDAGLRIMLTIMVGYPWEGEDEVKITYKTAKKLMLYHTHAGDCLQSSVITPYPGTPLWHEAIRKGWLKVKKGDYEKYDMSRPVLKSKYEASLWCQKIWAIQESPKFILKSGFSARSVDELKLLARGALSLLGHKKDYVKDN